MTITQDRPNTAEHTTRTSGSWHDAPPPARRSRLLPLAVLGLAVAIIGSAVVLSDALGVDTPPSVVERIIQTAPPAATSAPAGGPGVDAEAIGSAVVPSVVTVEVGVLTSNGFARRGSGSGVVIDDQGHIVTNDHVAGDADAVRVVLWDGTVYDAEVLGSDPVTDLAVLSISATDLTPIVIGSTEDLSVGAPSVAIGSPLGLDGGPSLTVGVISALGREVQTDAETILYGMIQTDAPITSGSSGGALVDDQGRLIAITTAVGVSPQVGIEGIGFATPVEVMERVASEIIAGGSASQALLGITGSTAYRSTADGGNEPYGVVVQSVQAGSGAAAADLDDGVVITSVDGVTVRTMDELIAALRLRGGGETVILVLSDGSTAAVLLGAA